MAVFSGPALRKNLHAGDADGLDYDFFPVAVRRRAASGRGAPRRARSWRSGPSSSGAALKALRRILPHRPVGSISLRGDAAVLKRSRELGYDFHLGVLARG